MIQCPLAANFASEVGSCREIVEQFKHLLHPTTHPQFLRLSCECPWALAQDNTVASFQGVLPSVIVYGNNVSLSLSCEKRKRVWCKWPTKHLFKSVMGVLGTGNFGPQTKILACYNTTALFCLRFSGYIESHLGCILLIGSRITFSCSA